ncbi:acetobutylicum phosphotransbutyrylase [Priestia aryabhattai]|uniref:VanZ family protein n=1 Tax=Priestia aryabhattai TaxID=412384 RepID=UPI000B5029E3|nr:VanZ family protein [Priestia aryabhattai]OVE35325.1 acetobutylicum phosphotransbutyrylase [Priestia aryabhattai]
MPKRILLIFLLLAISKFSHTPHLLVTNPSTWTNSSVWNHNATLWSILRPGSQFYTSYTYGFNLEFILRKIAHLSFFGMLGLLFYWNLKEQKYRYVKAWLCLVIFACLDEVHQAFIIGRDGRIVDVMIDSFGAALMLFLLYKGRKLAIW